MAETQKNPGGVDDYLVDHKGNFNDLSGGQQKCTAYEDFLKAISAISPDSEAALTAESLHDALSYLGFEINRVSEVTNHNVNLYLKLFYGGSEAPGNSVSPITFTPFPNPIPQHLFFRWNGHGNLNITVPIPPDTLSSLVATSASELKSNINTAIQNSEFKAYAPIPPIGSGQTSFNFSQGVFIRDKDADGLLELEGSEYEKHLIFLLLKTFYEGLTSRENVVADVGSSRNYDISPAGIFVSPGSDMGDSREVAISRAVGDSSISFDIDDFLANTLLNTVNPTGDWGTYVSSLQGSMGTKLQDDPRVAPSHLSVPIVVPIGIDW